MRLLALILLALAVSVGIATAATRSPGGSLEIKEGRGSFQITGKGVIVGRVDRGSLKIIDLTPADQWSPWVNGVPRGKNLWIKGRNITFRISAGRYRIVAGGDGVSVSARGTGTAVMDGDPDAVGDTGRYRVGDSQLDSVPDETTKTSFGISDLTASSCRSVKIQ
ncbi:hypothetical protein [Gaiella sp.]|uniref:hypothetical protein n=1 Tax=Gaiella sp. TaxID=2663207 RepID=UPI003263C926